VDADSFNESSAVCQKIRTTDEEQCGADWSPSHVGLRCYQRLPMQKFTSSGLSTACREASGGELVTIPDEDVDKEVFELCAERQPCFIGLKKHILGAWEWMSPPAGETKELKYANWADIKTDLEQKKPAGVETTEGITRPSFGDYAVIGISSVLQKQVNIFWPLLARLLLQVAVSHCVFTLIMFLVWYQGVTTRNVCCLQTSLCCDGCESFGACLSFSKWVGLLAGGISLLTVVPTLISGLSLAIVLVSFFTTYTLYSNIMRQGIANVSPNYGSTGDSGAVGAPVTTAAT